MLVLMMLALTAIAVDANRYDQVFIVTKGFFDRELLPVAKTHFIPPGQCSGIILKEMYDCVDYPWPSALETLRVTATSVAFPAKVEITNDFESVMVYGCGPIYVHLERACSGPIVQKRSKPDPDTRRALPTVPEHIKQFDMF